MCELCSVGEEGLPCPVGLLMKNMERECHDSVDKVHINKRCSDRTEFVFKAYKTSPPEPCSEIVIVPLSEGPSLFKGWGFDLLLIIV